MSESWRMSHDITESPIALDQRRDDLFPTVPPTPAKLPCPLQAHHQHLHHLRPSDSSYSLRSHRSVSSVGSVDSRASLLSGMSRWSTFTGSDSVSSGPDPFDGIQGLLHSRPPSLSIDPKLFRMKEKSPEEPDEATTAVPLVMKTPPKKTRAQANADRKKISHARKQHPEHIPRPRNAFILFRKHVVDSKLIPTSVEMRHQNVSIITAKMWSEAPVEQKKHFNEMARIEKEEHMKKYPGYRYQPVYRRTNVIRRRVRKDEAEEEKCASVAQLLLKGKSGVALESEIKNKIRRGPGSSSGSSKREKSGSRRGSAAIELSKGALRALRAQARQQPQHGSGDWSDASRGGSLAPSHTGSFDQDGYSRPTSLAYDSPDCANETQFDAGMQQPNYFSSASEAMAYGHPDFANWGFDQQRMNDGTQMEPRFAYPAGPPHDQLEIQHEPMHQPQYVYPQPPRPGPIDLPHSDFYTYDQALPFSPTCAQSNGESSTTQHMHPDMANNIVFGGYPTEGPSPTSAMYGAIGRPLSARWDRSSHLLPPSSEVAFENLSFDEGGLLLQDFEAALAHADDMASGW